MSESTSRTPDTEGPYDRCLWALVYAQMDWRAASDLQRAHRIRADIRCKRCEGTGNELMFMYRECPACKGTGVSRGNEYEFRD